MNTSPVQNLNQTWRQARGLPLNPNTCGPLTDKADYTFLDGRPTPLGMRQKRRLIKQREIATRIIQLSKEIDYAVERHKNHLEKQEEYKKNILENKLQPKGHLLLKNKN